MTGSVPAGSGLSSSAAMVVASTLAFLAVNNKLDTVTKGKLVEISMENEKRVGKLCDYKFIRLLMSFQVLTVEGELYLSGLDRPND